MKTMKQLIDASSLGTPDVKRACALASKADVKRVLDRVAEITEADYMRRLLVEFSTIPGVRVWRQNAGEILFRRPNSSKVQRYRGAPDGAADISGIYQDGTRLEIETKAAKGRKRDAQVAWGVMIESHGGIYVSCRHDLSISLDENARVAREMLVDRIMKKSR